VIKAKVMGWLQGSFGTSSEVLLGWALQAREWRGQQAWVEANQAELQRMRAVVTEFAWQPLAPAALGQSKYSHRR